MKSGETLTSRKIENPTKLTVRLATVLFPPFLPQGCPATQTALKSRARRRLGGKPYLMVFKNHSNVVFHSRQTIKYVCPGFQSCLCPEHPGRGAEGKGAPRKDTPAAHPSHIPLRGVRRVHPGQAACFCLEHPSPKKILRWSGHLLHISGGYNWL